MTALKVGALARRTGLTVRTLHHYDEIGLLSPSRRTASGHRLYGEDELCRLQQIAALKQLGLSLEEIGECLKRPEYSLERVIDMQLERIDEEIARQRRLRHVLESLRATVQSGSTSLEDLSRAVEATLCFERYYSSEQLEALRRRERELGQDRIRDAQQEWARLFEAFTEAMTKGVPPNAPEVAALARRSAALIEAFTGGDAGIAASLTEMYRTEEPDDVMSRHGMQMPEGLWEYMASAREALAED